MLARRGGAGRSGNSAVCSGRRDKPGVFNGVDACPALAAGRGSEGQALASCNAPGGSCGAGRGGAIRGQKLRGREAPPRGANRRMNRLIRTPMPGPPHPPARGHLAGPRGGGGCEGQRGPLTPQEERQGGFEISVVLVAPRGQCRVVVGRGVSGVKGGGGRSSQSV